MKVNRNALSHPAFFNRYVDMVGEDSINENEYATESNAAYQKDELIDELLHARKSNVLLFKSFKDEWLLSREGRTDKGESISLLSIAHIIIGHWLHHKKILTEKYGIEFN